LGINRNFCLNSYLIRFHNLTVFGKQFGCRESTLWLEGCAAYVGSVEHVAIDVLGDDGDKTGCAILLHCPIADEHRIFAAGEKNAQVHNAKKRAGKVKKLMP
jgi:hypothetical protein